MESTLYTKFAHLQIPLEDIVNATNNFHPSNIIGGGGFGPAYKGRLWWSGKLIKIVALRLDRKQAKGDIEFWTEVSALSNLKHPNIVSIVGFCDEQKEKIIITTFSAKGSLKEHLLFPEEMEHPNRLNVTWTQILKICVGIARAMSYLHHDEERGYSVIHLNINSSTILLNNKWKPMLSGFKVSVKQSLNQMDNVVLSKPIGILEYMDPEIEKTKGVTQKSDIYSFGVVLLEALCGRKAFIQKDGNTLPAPLAIQHYEENTMKDIIHRSLWDQMSPQSLNDYLNVLYSCLKEERADRPNSDYIVKQLEKVLEFQLRRENLVKKLEHLKIPLTVIHLATDYFSVTHKLESPDGCILYSAKLNNFDIEKSSSIEERKKGEHPKGHNRTVVIKQCVSGNDEYGEKQFLTDLEMLTCVKHRNIVTLLGFCVEGFEMILVAENVCNGYLSKYLLNDNKYKRILTWEKRLKICIDIAHAINYVHYEMEDKKVIIIHDMCCHNIVLDENWVAKITSFRDSLFLPPYQEDEALYVTWHGMRPYIDPEYKMTDKLKRESDVYSFGVVLFEILCGRTADDTVYYNRGKKGLASIVRHKFYLKTLEDMIDPIIKEGICENTGKKKEPNRKSLHTFIKIAHQCVAEAQAKRPTMKVVVRELKKALLFQQKNKEDLVLRMSLEDIKVATKNFHDDNCIGRGGSFGKFYKGKVQQGDKFFSIVAKRLDTRNLQGERQFLNELLILLEYEHENIIGLIGYCDEMKEKIIVYEYVSRSLDVYLNDASLTWMKRLNICIDVARVLDFLHRGEVEGMIHSDIHISNILLDNGWKAKVAGFGISLICQSNQKTPNAIYSFGLVLFEILCGRSMTVHQDEGHLLQDFVQNVFEGQHDEMVFEPIKEQIVPKSLRTFKKIAYQCLHDNRKKQPTIKKVLIQLKKALQFQKERRQHSNTDQVIDKLEKLQLAREIPKERRQHSNTDQVVDKLEKLQLAREIPKKGNNHRLSLEDIKRATGNFCVASFIAEGGFGRVFQGRLKHGDGFKTIAAKRLNEGSSQGEHEFLNEVQILLEYKHENIIGFVGYCDEKGEKIIVYECASRGSLNRHLNNASLKWEDRLKICIEVASAMDFLHGGVGRQAKVIHRDIKTSNILLNHDWKANLADFGLSLKSPLTKEIDYAIDHVCGTKGYLDPLYKKLGFLTTESDIYSFGVVLFEILHGRLIDDIEKLKNKFEVGKHDEVVFEQIREQIIPKSLTTFQEIAYQCLHHERDRRPTTKKVLAQLKKALEFQRMASTMTKFAPLQIPLEDVVKATNNFHDDNIIRYVDMVLHMKDNSCGQEGLSRFLQRGLIVIVRK